MPLLFAVPTWEIGRIRGLSKISSPAIHTALWSYMRSFVIECSSGGYNFDFNWRVVCRMFLSMRTIS